MLKIGKGLKKKKKSKKSKHKEDELFTEEELEQYRKEHSQKLAQESGENSEDKKAGGSEELEKFKLLTAGVDDILRKSQGDLDRIKKESFFQRKPTPSELKAQEEKEKELTKQTEGNRIDFEGGEQKKDQTEEEKEEESDSEYEFDDKDDIFDTTYVEALESGEVKLVYVPEDDEFIKPNEPDPFDTTSADEILKKVQEEEEKKKLQISLGLAVNVLTGRAERDKSILEETGATDLIEKVTAPLIKPKKRPRKIQDFVLIGSFDEGNNIGPVQSESSHETVSQVPKSLLDDELISECELPEGDTLIKEVLVKQSIQKTEVVVDNSEKKDSDSSNLKDLVSEFDVINGEVTLEVRKAEEVEDEFDEFTALAASSVANQKLEEELQKFEVLEDDPFDTSTASIVLKEETADPFGEIDVKVPSPQTADLAPLNQKWSAFNSQEPEERVEVDPFDTTFAEKIKPGKCELKLLESEILGDIAETAHKKSDVHLEARILSRTNSDIDFNPREGEEPPKPNNQSFPSKVCIQITDPSGFVETQRGSESESRDGDFGRLSFKHRDLLGGSTTDLTKLGNDPLAPEVGSPLEDFSKYSDPFDTSIVEQIAIPGKAELKFIEKELLGDISREFDEDTLSDKDFDPRKDENPGQRVSFDIPSPIPKDLLSSGRQEGLRPLTPYYPEGKDVDSDSFEIDDPFDTSHVTSLPGKEEIKLIEKELESVQITQPSSESINVKLGLTQEETFESSGLKHSLSDQDFNPREEFQVLEPPSGIRRFSDVTGLSRNPPSSLRIKPAKPDLLVVEEEHPVKALTPAVEEDITSYIDPFDTSIAENIPPGKAELKLLESELIADSLSAEGGIKRSYTDPDFNPRDEQPQVKDPPEADILNLSETSTVINKPLSPLSYESAEKDEIDPFDTSIATNLLPGKAEIKILESELIGQ